MAYKPSLVTFFDILGFRSLIETRDADFIEQVLLKLRRHAYPDEQQRELFEIDAIAFSDNVVRTVHVTSESNVRQPTGILWHELFALAWLQGLLIFDDGVFLRGAITANLLHLEDGIVFGPGLVRAYEVESREANYPRIIVDDKLIEAFQRHPEFFGASHHDRETDQEYIDQYAVVDSDGKRFIGYLNEGHLGDFLELLNALDRHHERVKQAAQANADNERVLDKYRWAASYHNRVVNEYSDDDFSQYETTKEAFLLTNEDVPDVEEWTIPET